MCSKLSTVYDEFLPTVLTETYNNLFPEFSNRGIAPNDTTTLTRDVFIGHFTCDIGTKTHLLTFNVSAA